MRNEKSPALDKDSVPIAFLAESLHQVEDRIAQARIRARRAGGRMRSDVFLAGEKAQQHIFVAHSSTAVLAAQVFERIGRVWPWPQSPWRAGG